MRDTLRRQNTPLNKHFRRRPSGETTLEADGDKVAGKLAGDDGGVGEEYVTPDEIGEGRTVRRG